MRTRYSFILPIAAILSGVVLELNNLRLIGNFLPNDVLLKAWPVLLAFVGLDLLFSQRRLIGGLVILFFAAALLSTQFLDGKWNNEIWKFFLKVWPILLILFGFDWVFSDRRLINTAVIVAGIVVLVYIAFTYLDVPAVKSLPFNIDLPAFDLPAFDLSSVLPTSTFSGVSPQPQDQQQNNTVQFFSQPTGAEQAEPVTVYADGMISAPLPGQNQAALNVNAASGTISLKAGNNAGELLSGKIDLDAAETLTAKADLNSQTAQYTLTSKGNADSPQNSEWDLSLSTQRTIAVNTIVNSGYIKADLRSMNLSDVNLVNSYGPIDLMLPHSTGAKIRLTAAGDKIRVYVPNDASVFFMINGASGIDYSQRNYTLSGNTLSPRRGSQASFTVEINANNSSVQIIDIG